MPIKRTIFTTECDGKPIRLEVSAIGEQANATVFGHYGNTTVMATVVMGKEDRDIDYLPLTVDYEEKFYAVGRILGSQYVRREGRASENAILSARIIDRTIRPLFNHAMRRDIQVVTTILSLDPDYDPHFIALLAASTALAISDVPWDGPVAGITIAKTDKGILVNPPHHALQQGLVFDVFAAGTRETINMIELEGHEAAEDDIVKALEQAQKEIVRLITFIDGVVKAVGKPKAQVHISEPNEMLRAAVRNFVDKKLEAAVYTSTKMDRQQSLFELEQSLLTSLAGDTYTDADRAAARKILEEEIDTLVHHQVLTRDRRPDGRRLDEVRPLVCEVGLLPRVHGSALFVRGNTQALALTTLGPPDDEQAIQTMEFEGKKRFLLHYNFPPYATGETGSFRGPGRREIGHGALAEKALRNLIPDKDAFPYTVRVVSEILSSNGSSSMASVCAGCLSLMDAGVPIKAVAAGIAMGLIMGENGTYKILTDIQGPEDHFGDMDCKVAGTSKGVTAMQMDVKIKGITPAMAAAVLADARRARLHILEAMHATLAAPRPTVSPFAPVVSVVEINPERIGEVIGPGGRMINGIIAETGATGINIEQSGKVYIYAPSPQAAEHARKQIEAIVREYRVGDIVEGTVTKILDFGAIVEFAPGADGMIHISELKDGYVKKVDDVVKVGDVVRARVVRVESGRIGLSLKSVPPENP